MPTPDVERVPGEKALLARLDGLIRAYGLVAVSRALNLSGDHLVALLSGRARIATLRCLAIDIGAAEAELSRAA